MAMGTPAYEDYILARAVHKARHAAETPGVSARLARSATLRLAFEGNGWLILKSVRGGEIMHTRRITQPDTRASRLGSGGHATRRASTPTRRVRRETPLTEPFNWIHAQHRSYRAVDLALRQPSAAERDRGGAPDQSPDPPDRLTIDGPAHPDPHGVDAGAGNAVRRRRTFARGADPPDDASPPARADRRTSRTDAVPLNDFTATFDSPTEMLLRVTRRLYDERLRSP